MSAEAGLIPVEDQKRVCGLRIKRDSSLLLEKERWYCPNLGCIKFYRKTSTLSVRRHKIECPKLFLSCLPAKVLSADTVAVPAISLSSVVMTRAKRNRSALASSRTKRRMTAPTAISQPVVLELPSNDLPLAALRPPSPAAAPLTLALAPSLPSPEKMAAMMRMAGEQVATFSEEASLSLLASLALENVV